MTIFLPPYEAPYKPVPQVTPLTYRDGLTVLKKIDAINRYINRVLVPFVDENSEELGDAFETQANALIEAFNAAVDILIEGSVEAQDPVVAALIADAESLTGQSFNDFLKENAEDETSDFRVVTDELYRKPSKVFSPVEPLTATTLQDAITAATAVGGKVVAAGIITTATTISLTCDADFNNLVINHTGTNTAAMTIDADNVSLSGVTIVGPGNTAHTSGSRGIWAFGTVSAYRKNVTISNVTISGFREGGIWLNFVDGFNIKDSTIENCCYAGIHGFSVNNGRISNNSIETITATPLAYGITINKAVDLIAAAPLSTDVIIDGNYINNVPFWEGLDTHGGRRITFSNNIVTGCKVGIACVYAKNEPGDQGIYAPKDITISGNVIDSLNTVGEADFGISFAGAYVTQGTPIDLATGTIVGNVIRNHGLGSDDMRGALYIHSSRATTVIGNTIINPSPNGIVIQHTNYDLMVANNVVVENFSTTAPRSMAITVRQAYNYATVCGNRHSASGEKTGQPLVNDNGLRILNATNNEIIAYGNDMASTTVPFASATGDGFRMQILRSANVFRSAPLSTASVATVDATYGTEERDVINNTRARVNSIETILQNFGLLE